MTKTLKDLFLSGNYPEPKKVDTTPISDDVSYDVDDKGAFLGKADWKYGTDYRDVGPENKIDFSLFGSKKIKLGDNTPNIFVSALDIVEAETNPRGIRISSAVELNNPLLYGNEATRIALRSTTILDRMKAGISNTPIELGNLAKVRDKINSSKLFGLTQPVTPTVVVEHTDSGGNITLAKSPISNRYSDISKITGGPAKKAVQDILSKSIGTPDIAARQLIGGTVSALGDAVRSLFFDDSDGNALIGINKNGLTDQINKYTNNINRSNSKNSYLYRQIDKDSPKLTNPSPIYGLTRTDNKFGTGKYAFVDNSTSINYDDIPGNPTSTYSSKMYYKDAKYSDIIENRKYDDYAYTLSRQGMGDYSYTATSVTNGFIFQEYANHFDSFQTGANADRDTDDFLSRTEIMPFWFRDIRDNTTTLFRATITNFSETITPNWEDGGFVGNPYKFKSYSGASRSVSVDFKIFALTEDELAVNWHKMKYLTKMTYPMFLNSNKLSSSPIIRFSIGNVYSKRYAVIQNLTYTISEDSRWETVTGAQVPKLIDVSMNLDLLENVGAENKPYDFANNSLRLDKSIKDSINNAKKSALIPQKLQNE